jgi:hypothetical protein
MVPKAHRNTDPLDSDMPKEHLSVYLNDHLAGGSAALELLAHLERAHPKTVIAGVASQLHADIKADHLELDEIMRRAGLVASHARQATAWLTEKIAELKMRVDDPTNGALRLLEALEALALGIDGKRSLWEGLAVASEDVPALQGVDYTRLIQRAQDQRRRVETLRLDAVKAALGVASTAE